eukprot:scaffold8573_cov164-Amphora_coffeaeformis.AAC.2
MHAMHPTTRGSDPCMQRHGIFILTQNNTTNNVLLPRHTSPIRDVLSGLIMAATSIPQLIAYAETVGYASYRGLSTAGPPLLAWGVVTGSPFMNAGVTSITAIMAKADLNGEAFVAAHGEQAYVELVAAYSFWIGMASAVLAVVGFGKVAQRVPKVVRQGFKWGCATGVLLAALPNGLMGGGSKEMKQLATALFVDFKSYVPGLVSASQVMWTISHPNVWNATTAALFVIGTLVVRNGKHFLPSSFPPGTEVILVTLAATLFSIQTDYAGGIVGEIPVVDGGMKIAGINIPVEFLNIKQVILETPLLEQFGGSALQLGISSLLFAAVNFLSIMGIASGFETEDGIAWSPAREMLAQGASCVVAATVGSAPVSGSLSRSLVSRMTGTTSQLACLTTALCWIVLQPYMSLMTPCPKAALSAIIVSAVVQGVVQPKDLLRLQGLRNNLVGWGTGLATICTSPTQGFGAGLVLYLVTIPLASEDKPKKKKE